MRRELAERWAPPGASDPWLTAILRADVYGLCRRTPLEPAPRLSQRLGQRVLLKREDQQPVFSFKLRGALNRLQALSFEERRRGVLAVSAGNHAQGVAMAARHLGIAATIVMPITTPAIKVEAVRAFGAEVLLTGDSYDEAAAEGRKLAEARGSTFIHPFDDPLIIAGQGTVAMELTAQHPGPLDAVFVPVGGGGLAAGMAVYLKSVRPDVRLIAVEPEDAACLAAALRAGRPVALSQVGLFVDGCAVREVGALNFELLAPRVDEVITVDSDAVCAAIRDIYEDTRTLVEPAGALAVAGLKRFCERSAASGLSLAAVVSGANIAFERLAHVAESASLGSGEEALFAVEIPERQGAFLAFARLVGKRPITEFNYRYADPERAWVFVGLRISGHEERAALLRLFAEGGYRALDLTEDPIAKLHVRHMVGGRAPRRLREHFFHFRFPERPGALLQFLEALGGRWNITLFHYRNHGAAYGRVLVGFEYARGEAEALAAAAWQLPFPGEPVAEDGAIAAFLTAAQKARPRASAGQNKEGAAGPPRQSRSS
ncbi:MAG: L-threonine dehydratase [Lysobacterales bacterium]|nr:MAG: L-threonine dehydratase [Xanthomonadales bacterium]